MAVLRSRRVDEARSPSLLRVTVERELRDNQNGAAHVGQREVHLVLGVRKNAKPGDLLCHPIDLGLAVAGRESNEDDETAADAARETRRTGAFANSNLGAGDPLQEDAHRQLR